MSEWDLIKRPSMPEMAVHSISMCSELSSLKYPTAQCKTRQGVFKAALHDLSSGGAFIQTSRRLSIGQEIAMKITIPAAMETHLITGEIARISANGAGVKFKIIYK